MAFREAVPRTPDRDRSANEAVHDLVGALNDRIPDDDRCFDVRADDDGAFHHTSRRNDRPFPDSHTSFNGRALFDCAVNSPLDVVEEKVVRLEDVLRLPGVLPPTLHDGGPDPTALFPQLVEGFRDLELVAPRWLLPPDDREDIFPEQVDSDQGELGLGRLRFLDQGDDVPLGVELRDAELLRVRDATEHHLGVIAFRLELVDHATDSALEDVVAQVDAERVVTGKRLRAKDRMGDSLRCALYDVGDIDAPLRAVPQKFPDLPGLVVPEDDADVRDLRVAEILEAVEHVRLVCDRDQLLRAGVRERSESSTGSPCEDDPLHRVAFMSSRQARNVGMGLFNVSSTLRTTRHGASGRFARSATHPSRIGLSFGLEM